MKQKIYKALSKPYVVVIVMVLATFFSYFDRNYGYFFGLFIAFLILWGSKFDWSNFGFGEKFKAKTIWKGLLLAIIVFIVVDIGIQPFLEIYFGPIDLSSVDEIRGNLVSFIIIIVIMWVFAAFGEEFLFSGYYMKHLARLMGDTNRAWFIAAIILSIYFGFSHSYQGTAGMIAVGLASTFYFFTFYANRTNLAILVFAHGFYDTIGLTLIHLDTDRMFYEWTLNMITNN